MKPDPIALALIQGLKFCWVGRPTAFEWFLAARQRNKP